MSRPIRILIWTVAWLVAIDVVLNFVFPGPPTASSSFGNRMVRYLHHGASIESKLRKQVEETRVPSDLVRAGWLSREMFDRPWEGPGDQDLRINVYGMSFTRNVARALRQMDARVAVRFLGGPGSPPSHTYAAFVRDPLSGESDVIVWGFLSSALRGLAAVTTANYMAEKPPAYMFPKYRYEAGRLERVDPVLNSFEDFETASRDPATWSTYVAQLKKEDPYFDPFVFHTNALDRSVLMRLIRRSWGKRHIAVASRRFSPDSDDESLDPFREVLGAMLDDFATRAANRGQRLIVLLSTAHGDGAVLDHLVGPLLTSRDIRAVSSNDSCPSSDPTNYIADGHFVVSCDRSMGIVLKRHIREAQLGGR